MTHRILKNMTGRPVEHPLTGQIIMPGQYYAEPEEDGADKLKKAEKPDPTITVQHIADPESTKKAAASAQSNKPGDK